MSEPVEQVLDVKAVEAQMLATHQMLEAHIKKAEGEIQTTQSVSTETKNAVEALALKATQIGDRLADLEQKQAQHFEKPTEGKSVGDQVVEAQTFKDLLDRKQGKAMIEVKTTIANNYSGGMAQPLVAGQRLDMVWQEPNRPLKIRDVLPSGRTDSNVIFFPKENVFTNSAAHQVAGSPTIQTDGTTLAESAITFTDATEYVKTIGHFIPVSLQALTDSKFLASYINSRLMYGLKLKEETELLNGTGGTGSITGINTASTAYAQADSPNRYSLALDKIRDAKRQAQQVNYEPTVVILNPKDWSDIELSKPTSGDGHYMIANPFVSLSTPLWGMRVVVSNSQTAGTFTVFDPMVYQIFDREDAVVEVAYEDSTNFQKLLATVRCYERLAFVKYSTAGCVKSTF